MSEVADLLAHLGDAVTKLDAENTRLADEVKELEEAVSVGEARKDLLRDLKDELEGYRDRILALEGVLSRLGLEGRDLEFVEQSMDLENALRSVGLLRKPARRTA